jgi:hypothetical protein
MPSDHAQFMFNFFVLFSLLVSVRCDSAFALGLFRSDADLGLRIRRCRFQNKLATPFLQLCSLGAALLVCYSRYEYAKYDFLTLNPCLFLIDK